MGHGQGRPYSVLAPPDPVHDKYLDGNYKRDPFYREAVRGLRPGLYRIAELGHPLEPYLQDYVLGPPVPGSRGHSPLADASNLAEEIAFVLPLGQGHSLHLAMIRSNRYPQFSDENLARLRAVQPIIEAAVSRHGELAEWIPRPRPKESVLTAREQAVVDGLLGGERTRAIARRLGISEGTVKVHRRNIYRKLEVSSLAELFLRKAPGPMGPLADASAGEQPEQP